MCILVFFDCKFFSDCFTFVLTVNGGLDLLLLSPKNDEEDSGLDQSCARFDDEVSVNGVIKPTPTGLCFLDAGMEWAVVRLNGEFEGRLAATAGPSSLLTFCHFTKVSSGSGG